MAAKNKPTSNTIAFFNERAYQQAREANPQLVAAIRADLEDGLSPAYIKAQLSRLFADTSPAEQRIAYQIALHLAGEGVG